MAEIPKPGMGEQANLWHPDSTAEPREQVFSGVDEIIVARDYGFCGGVPPAIDLAQDLLQDNIPLYTDNDIVHNRAVMKELREKGFQNVGDSWMEEDFDGKGKRFLISAHGTSDERRRLMEEKGFEVWDATCRLVDRVHGLVRRAESDGYHIVYRGVKNHPETRGSMGAAEDPRTVTLIESVEDVNNLDTEDGPQIPTDKNIIMFSQTTLMPSDVEDCEKAMKEKYGVRLVLPKRRDICPATINRQEAVEEFSKEVDAALIIGSPESHNSNELARTARKAGIPAYMVDYAEELQEEWFRGVKKLGLTAGASVLDRFIDSPIQWFLQRNPDTVIRYMGERRDKEFRLLAETQKRWDALKTR